MEIAVLISDKTNLNVFKRLKGVDPAVVCYGSCDPEVHSLLC